MTDKSYLDRVRKLSENEIPSFMRKALVTLKYKEKVAFLKEKGAIPFTEKGFEKVGWDFYKKTEEPDAGSIWAITAIQNDKGEEEKWLVVNVDENDQILRGVKASIKKKAGVDAPFPTDIYGFREFVSDNLGVEISDEEAEDFLENELPKDQVWTIDDLKLYFPKTAKKISHRPGAIVQVIVPQGHINEKYNGKIGEVTAAVPDRSQVNFKDMPPLWFEDNTITEIIPCPVCKAKISLQQLKTGRIRCRCNTVYSRRQLEKIVRKAQNVIFWFDDPGALRALKHLQGPPTSPAEKELLEEPTAKEVGEEETEIKANERSEREATSIRKKAQLDYKRLVKEYFNSLSFVQIEKEIYGWTMDIEHRGMINLEKEVEKWQQDKSHFKEQIINYHTEVFEEEGFEGMFDEFKAWYSNRYGEWVEKEASIKKTAVQISAENVFNDLVQHYTEFMDYLNALDTTEEALRSWLNDCGYGVTPEEFKYILEKVEVYMSYKEASIKKTKEKISKIVKEAQGGSQFEALRGGGGGVADQLEPMGWSVSESKVPKLPEETPEEPITEEAEEIVITVNPDDRSVNVDFGKEQEEGEPQEVVPEGAQAPLEKKQPVEEETREEGLAGAGEEVPVNF